MKAVLVAKNLCFLFKGHKWGNFIYCDHSISKLPYVRPKIWLSKLSPYSAVQNGEFHTFRVHFNNEKQPLQCTNNFFAWSVAGR